MKDYTRVQKIDRSKGFGDTVEKFTKATGIKQVVDTIAKATGKPSKKNKWHTQRLQ